MIGLVQDFHLSEVWPLTAVTAVLSNIISNVPAVLAIRPFVQNLPDQQHVWLVIAMSATLAGNLTLVDRLQTSLLLNVPALRASKYRSGHTVVQVSR